MEQESMISTSRRGRKLGKTSMNDPRSESRHDFMKIMLADPRTKLTEIPFQAAKERRQKLFSEKRDKRPEEEAKEIIVPENSNNKQLAQIIKQLAEALRQYEDTTRKELENIKKQIALKFQMTEMEQERVREIANSCEQKLGEIKTQTQKSKEENKDKMGHQDIRSYYIHNQFKFKNGLAMLKINEEKYIRVPIIPRFKFNKSTGRWTKKYFIQSMEE